MSAAAQTTPRRRRLGRRHVVLLALLPLLVAAWIPVLSPARPAGPAQPPPAPPPMPAPGGETAGAATAAGGGPATTAAPLDLAALFERIQRGAATRWDPARHGDPFAPADHADVTPQPEAARAALRPSSIYLSPGRPPVAIIDGRPCRPGDAIGGVVVHAIEERRVLFRDGDRTYAASLPEPALAGRNP